MRHINLLMSDYCLSVSSNDKRRVMVAAPPRSSYLERLVVVLNRPFASSLQRSAARV